MESYDTMIDFVLNELSPGVPVHFTRFHPDYKYTHCEKTPVRDVEQARERALERGMKYAYIGNAFDGDGLNTYCPNCHELLIERYGLHTYIKDILGRDGKCGGCGFYSGIKEIDPEAADKPIILTGEGMRP
jgi:pyruvate formate lyase activating enzyme